MFKALACIFFLGLVFLSPFTRAQEVSESSPQIAKIEIIGNRKIETDAILVRLKSAEGKPLDREMIREDIQALFKMNYFSNVQVERVLSDVGLVLRFTVVEKPTIAEIVFEGNSEIKNDDLAGAIGIKAYEISDLAKVKESVEKLRKLYEDKGYFLAKIEPAITDVKPGETVKLTYTIQENEKVKVRKITFLGNKNIPSSELKSKMRTNEEGLFTGISSSGQYKQDAFDIDIMAIRYNYYNLGYVKAKIDRPQVYVTPDKKSLYLTIAIEEGLQYNVGEIDFAGDLLFSRQELFDTIKLDENGIFALNVMQSDQSDLQAKYGDLGYAYANIIPRTRFNDETRTVDITFEFDKGNKVYFGQINVVGNSKTRDKVLRRELKILEGELYNETRRRKSLENIQRLGFFEEVNFKTSTPNDQLDIMNVDIVVKERNTGQINFGAGYGTSSGFTLQGSVKQTNFLGRGQDLGVSLSLASNYRVYDLSFTEPYFNDTEWSLGFRAFQSQSSGSLDYDEEKRGFSIFAGHPIGEYLRGNLVYSYTDTKLKPLTDASGQNFITDFDVFPVDTATGSAGSLGFNLEFDTRNDRFKPSKGIYARTGYSRTGFGGNLEYFKYNADFRYFKNLFWDVVFRNAFSYQGIGSLDESKDPPFNELYLLGGPYTLRGYRFRRVGRMVFSRKIYNERISKNDSPTRAREQAMRFFGGKQQLMYQGELQFPLIKEADMYGVAFYDIGQAEDQISDTRFFADTGLGIRWFSPIGPLRFEWGFPLNRDPLYHENTVFEFSIGTPF